MSPNLQMPDTRGTTETDQAHPVDPHVALWAERSAKKAAHEEADRQWHEEHDRLSPEEQETHPSGHVGALYDSYRNVEREIAETPATTVFGVMVKIRAFLDAADDVNMLSTMVRSIDEPLLRSAVADAERLAGAVI